MTYDVIVLGLGAMGGAAAYELARRGLRVLGIDRFRPPHNLGSSHGETRVIRLAYFEDPAYVPLLRRAYDLWRKLEGDCGRELLVETGGLMIGTPDSEIVSGTLRSVQEHGLPHEFLDAAELARRFPAFKPDASTVAIYEARAGFVWAEATVEACLRLAAEHGARLQLEEPVRSWRALPGGGVAVVTERGTYEAGHLVVAAGAWAGSLLADLQVRLQPSRQVLAWLQPTSGAEFFRLGAFPIFAWQPGNEVPLYGFPMLPGQNGVKVAMHGGGPACHPDTVDRTVHPADVQQLHAFVAGRIPGLGGPPVRSAVCMYTNTPDGHFIIDRHPAYDQVTIAAGFSGHGFKFVPVVGEIIADLVGTGRSDHPIGLFRLDRFGDG